MEQNETKIISIPTILSAIVITALLVGGGVYYGQNLKVEKMRKEIEELGGKSEECHESSGFGAYIISFNLSPSPGNEEIKVKFDNKINEATANFSTIKLWAVGKGIGMEGERTDLSGMLKYSYNEVDQILTIISKTGEHIGGCASCVYELELTSGVKDIEGNSLEPFISRK
ncbi:MAG: hypothetical protein V1698_01665 [bacterium]